MDVQAYLADISVIDTAALLSEWRWLLGDRQFAAFLATAMGDLVLREADSQFWFLDMVEGKLRPLADSESELWAVLGDRGARKTLLLTFIVRGLRDAGVVLTAGECYSPEQPPILGGTLMVDNLRPCNLLVHSSIMGQIHRQVSELPRGTPISSIRIERPAT